MSFIVRVVGALVLALVVGWSRSADACGCLAPPSPAEPIVQAGERILFAVQNGVVTAHIQVQYAGDAKDFGWLLPLPSVPTLTVGTDELFNQLAIATDPQYLVQQNFTGEGCPPPPLFSCGCYAPVALRSAGEAQDAGTSSALVTRSSVGPYDYAVLRADDQSAMLQWLADNRFFVPAGTDTAVGPYIRPGSYFLALKLKSGASTGDITPVVVKYPSSLPMIPIILTKVGAQPNMGVLVYLLGNGRGIPRNYHHVVINDALLDWFGGAKNYGALVTRAVAEAPQRHAFVTDYAGPSSVMKDRLAAPGRFGSEADFAATTTPRQFVSRLFDLDYADPTFMPPALPAPVVRVLLTQIPVPDTLTAQGITPSQFFAGLSANNYNLANFPGYMTTFDAPSLAQKLFAEFVTPVREANALFTEFPQLTRLYTTLSPEDMTEDPVFSFNPDLPEVKRTHTATFTAGCGPGQLETGQGWQFENVSSATGPSTLESPAALRVEVLGEEGQPTIVTDNQDAIHAVFQHVGDKANPPGPQQGCSTVDPLSLGIFAVMFLRRRTRS